MYNVPSIYIIVLTFCFTHMVVAHTLLQLSMIDACREKEKADRAMRKLAEVNHGQVAQLNDMAQVSLLLSVFQL